MTNKVGLNSNNLHISNSVMTFCQLNSFSGNCNVYSVLLNVSGVVSPDGIRQIPFTMLVRYNVGYSGNSDGQLVQNWECLGLESVGKLEEDGRTFVVVNKAEPYLWVVTTLQKWLSRVWKSLFINKFSLYSVISLSNALMAELADAQDLKSCVL